jgi:magnesium transporter
VHSAQELTAEIRQCIDRDLTTPCEMLRLLPVPEIADVLNRLTRAEVARVLTKLPQDLANRVCNEPSLRRRSALLDELDPDLAARILNEMYADQRTEVVRGMSPHERHRLLPKLSPEHRAEVEQLLKYPPHTAGGIMTTEFVRLDPSMTVGAAYKHIRAVARERESIYACYVLEPGTDKLLGAVSMRDLVMAEMNDPLTSVMRTNPIAVKATDDQEVVAQKIGKYNLLAVPVLESDGRVVGFVTVDDVIDVLNEEGTEDIQKFGGLEGGLELPYMATPYLTLVRMRAVWLVILFLGEMLTATAMGFFEDEIARAVVLAMFIPLIISSGGNSGSQAATLIIRALALGEVTLWDW